MLTTTTCHIPFNNKICSKHASTAIPEELFVLNGKLCATLMENTGYFLRFVFYLSIKLQVILLVRKSIRNPSQTFFIFD